MMKYSIGQIAQMFGESVHTFRYYDKEGLLPFTKRDENGIRYYDENDIELFAAIQCLKNAHMPLKKIAKFISLFMQGDATISQRRQMFEEQKQLLANEIAALQDVYENLRFRCWFFEQAEKAGTVNIKYDLDSLPIPEDLLPLKEKYGHKLLLNCEKQEKPHKESATICR